MHQVATTGACWEQCVMDRYSKQTSGKMYALNSHKQRLWRRKKKTKNQTQREPNASHRQQPSLSSEKLSMHCNKTSQRDISHCNIQSQALQYIAKFASIPMLVFMILMSWRWQRRRMLENWHIKGTSKLRLMRCGWSWFQLGLATFTKASNSRAALATLAELDLENCHTNQRVYNDHACCSHIFLGYSPSTKPCLKPWGPWANYCTVHECKHLTCKSH